MDYNLWEEPRLDVGREISLDKWILDLSDVYRFLSWLVLGKGFLNGILSPYYVTSPTKVAFSHEL